MRALTYTGPDALEWREAPDAKVAGDGEAVVRPLAVATCDLDDLIVAGRSPFPAPFAVGHEGVGEVVDAGDRAGVAPGDRVLIPFQISCGECGPCREGRTGNCDGVPPASTYGFGFGSEGTRWGGFLADLVHVPFARAMLIPIPAGLDPQIAAGASDNLTDAYRSVGPQLKEHPGAPVLVVGGAGPGSIGLYAAAQARALGSEAVLYVDEDAGRRAIAATLGVETLDHIPERIERTFPITVDASGRPGALPLALRSLARDGICTVNAIYFREPPPLPMFEMYVKNTTLVTGRIHARRDAPAVLDLLAAGHFDPAPVTTRTVSFDDAPDALTAHDFTKLVFVPRTGLS